jgi:uncharacterized membrane protein (UPF0127 family)
MHRRTLLTLAATLSISVRAKAQAPDPTGPQPQLPKEKLTIVTHDGAEHIFNVEMALKPDQQIPGEMFRTSIPEDGGMLFDWGFPRDVPMWMRNTLVPLDIVFINADGTIRAIAEDTTPRSLAPISSRGPARATLELPAGATAKLDIRVGDTVKQRIFNNVG